MKLVLNRTRRHLLVAAAAVGVSAVGVTALAPVGGLASSHREAPLIAGLPSLDNTDLYAFVSPDATSKVTIVANWQPFEEPVGGPNFYPFATRTQHDVNIDNNGDALADITYRWIFSSTYQNPNTFLYNTGPVTALNDSDLNFRQTYSLQRITPHGKTTVLRNAKVAPSYTGAASMPDYETLSNLAITRYANDTAKSFAGQADDSFFADLRIFDLLYGTDLSETGQDTLAGYNVNTIALQVPKNDIAYRGNATRNPVVGIWSTTNRADANMSGRGSTVTQVSRLGAPLVNEAVIPVGKKNEFNASTPRTDAKFLSFVQKPEVPKLVEAIYNIPAPAEPRADLVEVFLTGVCMDCGPVEADLNSQMLNTDYKANTFAPSEQLRLNMSVRPTETPNRMGVLGGDLAGYPNGRRLTDDVIDITLQAAQGALLPDPPAAISNLDDAVNANDRSFRTAFPYVALPNTVAVNQS